MSETFLPTNIDYFIPGIEKPQQKPIEFQKNPCFLVFPSCLIYMELVLKIATGMPFWNIGLLFMPLFSIFFGTLFSILCTSFTPPTNRRLVRLFLILFGLLFSTQIVYHWCFDKLLILYSIGAGGADQVIEDGILETTLTTIKACAIPILLTFVPAILSFIFLKRQPLNFPRIPWRIRLISFLSNIGFYGLILLLVFLIPSANEIYRRAFDPNLTTPAFGLLHTEAKDLQYNVFGLDGRLEVAVDRPSSSEEDISVPETPWVMDFDFSALSAQEKNADLKNLHTYFSNRTPSYQNEYTGMFKDYNLIYITAEGFSPYAIHETYTPTLYKMAQKGFQFENFYTPIWGVSTSDGEYVNCTGLLPKSGTWSFYQSGKQRNNMPFTMGRQFLKKGVPKVYAYHNHSYSYYHRDVSHTNMGYRYTGYGNGLEKHLTKVWPESDYEMIAATADKYIKQEPFHAYYMTVSGHLQYSFSDNSMAKKHQKAVADMEASERVKAYMACQIELDRAMELLLEKLEKAGVADKTLIVLAPDHYPYGLEDKENKDKYHYFSEILGHNIDPNFELYKSALLMYSPSMNEPIKVSKYCSNLDIIPTLNNLFGMEHDSRLLMGRDILSSAEPLVVFANHSFITDKGMYNASTNTFTTFDGKPLADEVSYVAAKKAEINNMFVVSAGILEQDYYGVLLGTRIKP